jgi:hypothetical protein
LILKQLPAKENKAMKDLIKTVDELPFIVKLILCLPALDIVWAIYRIIKGVVENDAIKIVIGIIWVFGGCTITWAFDLITTLLYKHPKLA